MKLGVTMYSFNRSARASKIDVEGFIRFCGTLGIQGVDLLEYYWRDKEAEMRAVPGWLREASLEMPAFAVGNNFAHDSAALREQQIDAVKRGIDTAAALEVRYLRIFGGSVKADPTGQHHDPKWGVSASAVPAGLTHDQILDMVVECLRPCVRYAERKNIVLAIENHGGVPGTSGEVIRVIEAVNSPYLRALLDFGNFLQLDQDPLEAIRGLAPYTVHAHFKDVKKVPPGTPESFAPVRGDFALLGCLLGEGDVDVRGGIQILRAAGYDGYLTLEFEAPSDEKDGVRVCVDRAKALLRELA
jgi:sugar phosphate isomerase/epimerase